MFPSRARLAGLAEQEYQALRSASRSCTHLSAEAAEAEALTLRLCNGSEDMAASEQDSEFTLASTALRTLLSRAFRWDRAVSEIAYSNAAAAVMIGGSILQRVTGGEAPVSAAELKQLTGEPTMGDLRRILRLPLEQHLPAVPQDPERQTRARADRDELLALLDGVEGNLRDDYVLGEVPAKVIEVTFLVEATPDDMDPLWEPLVQPLFTMASQMVWEIQAVLGALPNRVR